MTRQDYKIIAAVLRRNLEVAGSIEDSECRWAVYAIHDLIDDFTETLARHNLRFDEAKFRAACGLENLDGN